MTDDQNTQGKGKAPSFEAAYASKGKDGKTYFNPIGKGFEHSNGQGGHMIRLNAPMTIDQLHIFPAKERVKAMKDGQSVPPRGRDDQGHDR